MLRVGRILNPLTGKVVYLKRCCCCCCCCWCGGSCLRSFLRLAGTTEGVEAGWGAGESPDSSAEGVEGAGRADVDCLSSSGGDSDRSSFCVSSTLWDEGEARFVPRCCFFDLVSSGDRLISFWWMAGGGCAEVVGWLGGDDCDAEAGPEAEVDADAAGVDCIHAYFF